MPFQFELEDEAKADFWNAYDYYAEIDPEIAFKFAREFEKAVEHIITFPDSGSNLAENFQCIFLDKFPHYIVYEIKTENLIIGFAVAHTSRKPNYWKK